MELTERILTSGQVIGVQRHRFRDRYGDKPVYEITLKRANGDVIRSLYLGNPPPVGSRQFYLPRKLKL